MNDYANRWTDQKIASLERRIEAVFRKARDDLQRSVNAYFAGFAARDNAMRKRLEAGEITQREYRRWLRGQLTAGARWKALRDKVAQRMTDAREAAVAYANDETPGIYSLNRNYAAFTIEGYSDQVDFTLWDERAVRNLLVHEPNLMPYYPPPLAVNRGIDLAYGQRVITDMVTSAVLRGSSIPKIAKELMDRIPDMSRQSATRAARTACGSAQNAGVMDTAVQAEKMGLEIQKWWIATLDNRTRDSHQAMDGQHVDVDKPFSNGLMYPKDPSGPPSEVYNCRCSMAALPAGVDLMQAQRRARDPATGKSVVIGGMTYREWANQKRAENKTVWAEHSGKIPLRERLERAFSEVDNAAESGIIASDTRAAGSGSVKHVGTLDSSLISSRWQNVKENVVITDERIAHILEGHRADYEAYGGMIGQAIESPQYILADAKNDNTALYIGQAEDTSISVVVKLAFYQDPKDVSSSVITMYRCGEKRLRRLVKNNENLYRRE